MFNKNYLENFKPKMALVQFLTEKNSHHHVLTEGKDPAFTCIPFYEHLIFRKAYGYAYFSESREESLKDRCFHWTEKKTVLFFWEMLRIFLLADRIRVPLHFTAWMWNRNIDGSPMISSTFLSVSELFRWRHSSVNKSWLNSLASQLKNEIKRHLQHLSYLRKAQENRIS